MNQESFIIDEILKAREERYLNKLKIEKHLKCIIELSLNVPGYPKVGFVWQKVFNKCISAIEIAIPSKIVIYNIDSAGYYALFNSNIELREAKIRSCFIEDKNEWGRIVDIDCSENGRKMSREEIGLKERKCFLCDNPHSICITNKHHNLNELKYKAYEMAQSLLF